MITIRDWIPSIPPEEKSIAYVGEGEAVTRQFLLTGEGWETYRDWGFYLDMGFDLSTVTQRESWVRETTQQTQSENFTENGTSESTTTSSGSTQTTESVESESTSNSNVTRSNLEEREEESTVATDVNTTNTQNTKASGSVTADEIGNKTSSDNATVTGGGTESGEETTTSEQTISSSCTDVTNDKRTENSTSDGTVTDSTTENGSTESASTSSGTADSTITKETRTVTQVVVNCASTTDIAPLSKEVTEEGLMLTWVILRQHTQLPGRLRAVVRAMGPAGQVKKTAIMLLEVEPSVVAAPAAEIPLSEFQQMEIRMSYLVEQASDQADRAEDAADTAEVTRQSCSALQESAAAQAVDAASWARKAELQATAAGAAAADALTYKQGAEGVMSSVNSMESEVANAKDEAVAAQTAAVAARDEAVLAKNQATVAKSGAEAAKSAAGTAKSGAEAAKRDAEAAAADATALVAQADAALQEAQIATAALTAQTANALTADRRGCAVRVDDLSPLEHPYTVTVEGENLIPYPFADTTKTNGDYTFTDNGNGTVSFSGGRTDSTVPQGLRFTFVDGLLLSAGTYVLSGGADVRAPLHFVLETAEGASTYMLNAATDTQEITVLTDAQLTVFATLDRSLMGRTVVFAPKAVRKDLSGVTVRKYGKNLLPSTYHLTSSVVNGVTVTAKEDGTIILNGTAEKFTTLYLFRSSSPLVLPKGVAVSLSGVPGELAPSTAHDCYITLRTPGNEQTITDYGNGNHMITEYTEYECRLYFKNGGVMNNVELRPQIEIGGATAWEAYEEPASYTVTADGLVEGMELLAGEDVTLVTDSADTVVRCVYNRDTNKVIEELVNAIISLGGNV